MKLTTMTTQKQQKIKNRQVPNYNFLALSVMIILLLDFVNSVNAAVKLNGLCTTDAGKIASLKIGPARNFDLTVSFPANTKYVRGVPIPITIDVNKDEVDAMMIYAFGKGDDQFRVGSWDSTSLFNWDITCGNTQAEQNSTMVAVGQVTNKVTLSWYPPNTSGNGDISFRALVINQSGYEIITTNAIEDSTNTPVTTATATAPINTSASARKTKGSATSNSYPSKTSINGVDTTVPSSNAINNLDSSSFIVIMLSSTFLLLMLSFPLSNIMIL